MFIYVKILSFRQFSYHVNNKIILWKLWYDELLYSMSMYVTIHTYIYIWYSLVYWISWNIFYTVCIVYTQLLANCSLLLYIYIYRCVSRARFLEKIYYRYTQKVIDFCYCDVENILYYNFIYPKSTWIVNTLIKSLAWQLIGYIYIYIRV